jgi:transposase-like protein
MTERTRPEQWGELWAHYQFRNERCRYEYDRKTKGAFRQAVPWNERVLLGLYRITVTARRIGRVA